MFEVESNFLLQKVSDCPDFFNHFLHLEFLKKMLPFLHEKIPEQYTEQLAKPF